RDRNVTGVQTCALPICPLVGFNPNRLVKDAGIRIDPPPSLAPATGTIPEATAAAAPPLEPPGEKFLCHGLRVAPCRAGSVIFLRANSGVFVYPVKIGRAHV